MAETNYSNNSIGNQKPEKSKEKVEKVIDGEVKIVKKTLGRRIIEAFSVNDGGSIKEYLLFDVIVPNTKALILDLLNQGIERKFYGEGRRGYSGSYLGRSRGEKTRYVNYSKLAKEDSRPKPSSRVKDEQEFDGFVFETRGEAEIILDKLSERIENYDVASVSDLYELVGMTADFSQEEWGWTDLRRASVMHTRDGYRLDLPRPTSLR